ncbi:MAG: AAA family ATPase [Rubrobacter sp.]|nr:AAA family ATPase [Rubrobacter sp.]
MSRVLYDWFNVAARVFGCRGARDGRILSLEGFVQSSRVGSLEEVREVYGRLRGSIRRVIVGKDRVVELCLISLFAGGHVLLTDIPGVGKTTLAKTISSSIAAEFSRIQFTPDLLPSDITGTSIYDPREASFKWLPGPVFAPVLLADEINRATPRTQSALLEAMAENQVTVENETRALPEPFFVVATQNPHQFHGTYPLPEGQLDRSAERLPLRPLHSSSEQGHGRRRVLPLRGAARLLRAVQLLARGDGQVSRYPGAYRHRLHVRRVQPVHRALRGQGLLRPRVVGRGVLSRLRLVHLRPDPRLRLDTMEVQGRRQHAGQPGLRLRSRQGR